MGRSKHTRLGGRGLRAVLLAFGCLAGSVRVTPAPVSCATELSECIEGLFVVVDSCNQPSTNPDYHPCRIQSCQSGICQAFSAVPNGTPCDDAAIPFAPAPNGACTSSTLRSVAGYPRSFSCSPNSPFDCPQNHVCLCDGAECPEPCNDCGVCVCNNGCGAFCNDACVAGVCTRDILALAEPNPLTAPSATSIAWTPTADAAHWNSYRGTIPRFTLGSRPPTAVYDHACLESADALGDGPAVTTDAAAPPPRTAFYYLASGEGVGCESDIGHASSGAAIPNVSPCPTPP